jgi:anti-sigma factor RsiW
MTRQCVKAVIMVTKNIHPHGEQISAYIDGMLDVGKTRGIAKHLRGCASCRGTMEGLQETKTLLRRMPTPTRPGPEFWTDNYRRLRVDDRERAVMRRPLWEAWRGPEQAAHRRWAAGLAAVTAVAALIAGPLTVSHDSRPLPPPAFVAADVSPDVSSLVQSHTDSVSATPLDDPDGQKMIAADARQAPSAPAEAADYADITF